MKYSSHHIWLWPATTTTTTTTITSRSPHLRTCVQVPALWRPRRIEVSVKMLVSPGGTACCLLGHGNTSHKPGFANKWCDKLMVYSLTMIKWIGGYPLFMEPMRFCQPSTKLVGCISGTHSTDVSRLLRQCIYRANYYLNANMFKRPLIHRGSWTRVYPSLKCWLNH